ncbi:MAG: hypothetical protein DRJ03_28440 [Chloroflexi bacterium]|nr:MAG: hypothetical protein DRJ03_28440 [Chloroflexota bacterium]
MALKGNILFNGDFETGTSEGWIEAPYGQGTGYTLYVLPQAAYKGEYGGYALATEDGAVGQFAYDKVCSFEEEEAYLFIMYAKMISGFWLNGLLYGLDDKGNLIQTYRIGYITETGEWKKIMAILRGYKDITHFKVGVELGGFSTGDKSYIDEVKLFPLRSIRSHILGETITIEGLEVGREVDVGLACFGSCVLRSILKTYNVEGTNPTLNTRIEVYLFDAPHSKFVRNHTQFTTEQFEEVKMDLPEISFIRITYAVGGDNPSFDIEHNLRIEPTAPSGEA